MAQCAAWCGGNLYYPEARAASRDWREINKLSNGKIIDGGWRSVALVASASLIIKAYGPRWHAGGSGGRREREMSGSRLDWRENWPIRPMRLAASPSIKRNPTQHIARRKTVIGVVIARMPATCRLKRAGDFRIVTPDMAKSKPASPPHELGKTSSRGAPEQRSTQTNGMPEKAVR